MSPLSHDFRVSNQMVRPMAKPAKPSAPAPSRSQCSTRCWVGAAPQHHSAPVRALGARLGGHPVAVATAVDALDLPHVRLDPGRLQLGDRPDHQLRPKTVVVRVDAASLLQLLLGACLHRHRQDDALRVPAARDISARLLIDKDPRGLTRRALAEGTQETLIDHLLGVGYARSLSCRWLALQPEETLLEGAAMIEGKEVKAPAGCVLARSPQCVPWCAR